MLPYGVKSDIKFKSDRCGIETVVIGQTVAAFTGSNQTVAGLKRKCRMGTRWYSRVQIRPLRDWNVRTVHVKTTFTDVQIRPLRDWNSSSRTSGFCHAKVQIRPLRDWNVSSECEVLIFLKVFKSDRCGIETIMTRWFVQWMSSFKSDRCGIETTNTDPQVHHKYKFKSDRCGIETYSLLILFANTV